MLVLLVGLRIPRHSRLACIPGGLDSICSAVPLVQVWISFLGCLSAHETHSGALWSWFGLTFPAKYVFKESRFSGPWFRN
jgi:hypothetical protein